MSEAIVMETILSMIRFVFEAGSWCRQFRCLVFHAHTARCRNWHRHLLGKHAVDSNDSRNSSNTILCNIPTDKMSGCSFVCKPDSRNMNIFPTFVTLHVDCPTKNKARRGRIQTREDLNCGYYFLAISIIFHSPPEAVRATCFSYFRYQKYL